MTECALKCVYCWKTLCQWFWAPAPLWHCMTQECLHPGTMNRGLIYSPGSQSLTLTQQEIPVSGERMCWWSDCEMKLSWSQILRSSISHETITSHQRSSSKHFNCNQMEVAVVWVRYTESPSPTNSDWVCSLTLLPAGATLQQVVWGHVWVISWEWTSPLVDHVSDPAQDFIQFVVVSLVLGGTANCSVSRCQMWPHLRVIILFLDLLDALALG